jgi:anti-sigma B factor antagonist
MEGIQVSVEKIGTHGDVSVIRVGGYIDTTTSSELERALDSLLKAGIVHIIIDLGNVDYISSAGWGIFISEIKGIRERGGDLKLSRMIPDVYEVFELLEFHYILKAYDTVEEAIHDFDKEMGRTTVITEETHTEKESPVAEKNPIQEEESIPVELEDKIRQIALNNPSWGASNIAKELNTEKYGFLRIKTLSVWKMLRKMNLSSKKQRESQASWE